MCLWLLTACLGLLPANPTQNNVIVVGAPQPILQPTATAATTTTTTTTFRPGNTTTQSAPPTNATTTNPNLTTRPATNTTLPVTTNTTPRITTTTGFPNIDPRLGTTQSIQLQQFNQMPLINGYNAMPSYDTAVRFPRDKREASTESLMKVFWRSRRRKRQSGQNCSCVPAGTCPTQVNVGTGMIDFRIVTAGSNTCPAGQVYCCFGGTVGGGTIACGVRQSVPTTNIVVGAGQAAFGEFPWMAMILTNQNDYIAGGVLINQYNVLTVIHRLSPYIVAGAVPNVKVRLGEWDAAATYEPIPYQEYSVQRIFTHPSYNYGTLQYDIAVLRLSRPVPFSPARDSIVTVNRACLPATSTATYTGQRCWVSGWGKSAFGPSGVYQQILKEVIVPIVDSNVCESQLRTARLGANYFLDRTSFICAGGEANMDSCTGDGGSGLVCEVNGQWTVVGLVAWGLGCASPSVPGVYVNIAALSPWIQQQIATT